MQHCTYTFFWKYHRAHSQEEASCDMCLRPVISYLSLLWTSKRDAQIFLIAVVLKIFHWRSWLTAYTNDPSLWPESFSSSLQLAVICNGGYGGVLISCGKEDRKKKRETEREIIAFCYRNGSTIFPTHTRREAISLKLSSFAL